MPWPEPCSWQPVVTRSARREAVWGPVLLASLRPEQNRICSSLGMLGENKQGQEAWAPACAPWSLTAPRAWQSLQGQSVKRGGRNWTPSQSPARDSRAGVTISPSFWWSSSIPRGVWLWLSEASSSFSFVYFWYLSFYHCMTYTTCSTNKCINFGCFGVTRMQNL